jgi:hypothetical protein
MNRKKKNERALKRAKARAQNFRALTAMYIIAEKSCDICSHNTKNEKKKYQNTWSWSSSNHEIQYYCNRFIKDFKSGICHMFEDLEVEDE